MATANGPGHCKGHGRGHDHGHGQGHGVAIAKAMAMAKAMPMASSKATAKAVENAANGEDDPANPKMKKGEKTKLEKLQVKLNELVAQIEALIGEMTENGVSDMVPGYASTKALAQKTGAQDAASLIELSVTTGCGDATDLLKKGNDAVTNSKLAVATLANLIHEAVAHLGA